MEKRVVVMIYELLLLIVEKKIILERIVYFRVIMDLFKKFKDFFF